MHYDQINEASNSLSELPWITKEDRHNITAVYGAGVLSFIDEICSFTTNDTIWTSLSDEEAFIETLNKLSTHYPYLTDTLVIKVANLAAYFWR